MKKLWILLFCLLFVFTFSFGAFAEKGKNPGLQWDDISQYFDDLDDTVNENEKRAIQMLFFQGLIKGIGNQKFAPHRSLSYAEAVTMYVTAFNLNIDHLRFIKPPQATDSYDKVPNDAWYADAFVKAFYNGVTFPRDVNPNATISKQEFAHYLYQIVEQKAGVVTTQIWHEYKDMDKVDDAYKASINHLITIGIIELKPNNQFQPTKAISRAQAALMIYKALKYFGDEMDQPILEPVTPVEKVEVFTEKVSDDVQKVTIYWGEKPNPGYSVTIDRIEFAGQTATIYYTLHYPDPEKFYPMVITTAKASTYVDTNYTIKTVQSGAIHPPIENPELDRFEGYVVKKDNNRVLVTSNLSSDFSETGGQQKYYPAFWYSNIPKEVEIGHKVEVWYKVGIELTIYPGQRKAEKVVILPSATYAGAKLSEDAAIRKALSSKEIVNANLIAPVIKDVQYVHERNQWKITITESGEAKTYEITINDVME